MQRWCPYVTAKGGKVNPEWLSACREERNLTEQLMEQIAAPLNVSKAYQKLAANGGSAGADGMKAAELNKEQDMQRVPTKLFWAIAF